MKERLNFSPRPFRTRAPLLLVLWVTNLLLAAALVLTLWHWKGLRDQNSHAHDQIDTLKGKQQDLARQNDETVRNLEQVDIKSYRKRVRQFYEIQAAFQTHWGMLLDQLGTLLPEDVRLRELRPMTVRSDKAVRERRIHLTAEARNKEAQLAFIRTLQTDAAFHSVSFESETYRKEGVALLFEISFDYRPGGE